MIDFDYKTAFGRNIGWVTPDEQAILRHSRVAIGGLGGVGGVHAMTLARLGVAQFTIADFDTFSLANVNRQAGAFMSTVGKKKADVIAAMVRDINPEADVRVLPEGVNEQNIDAFLDGVDVYVDGIDFFAVGARRLIFRAAGERGIPAVTAAPLGMGAAVLCFLPGGMSFEEYFRLDGQTEFEQLLRFLLGLSPSMLQRTYLVCPSAVDFAAKQGPSMPMACEICAGIAGAQVLKILLKRGDVLAAPRGMQFDAYRNRLSHTWRPGGNRNPLQRIGLWLARRQLAAMGDGKGA